MKLLRGELIGCQVEVVQANNSLLVGKKGKVVDETRNMIELDNNRRLVKNQVILKVGFCSDNYIVDGRLLVGRPEDRIKKGRSLR